MQEENMRYYSAYVKDKDTTESELRPYFPRTQVHLNPISRFEEQYKLLQEEKLKKQLKTQNDALLQQQQTFALRQQLNPPVPTYSPPNRSTSYTLPDFEKNPPCSLDLDYSWLNINKPTDRMGEDREHYSDKRSQENDIFNYGPRAMLVYKSLESELHSPQRQVIIQQNHPSLVVNQACQTQMSDPSPKSSSSTSVTPQSPPNQQFDKKKKENSHIRSPIAKRSLSAPISISGWLYKQGSEGLKVWRKRWFVLSEYCLFYYKSSDETKLLGSVLLPSYHISICSPEDKVYRKFAFKCEHNNMRTYWLAAETQEQMTHWITALSAASLMQSIDESVSEGSRMEQSVKSLQTVSTQSRQPLYANAPPKPKRLISDEIFSTSNIDQFKDVYLTQQKLNNHLLDFEGRLVDLKRLDMFKYSSDSHNPKVLSNELKTKSYDFHQESSLIQPQLGLTRIKYNEDRFLNSNVNNIRRTPDIYGTAKTNNIYHSDVYIDEQFSQLNQPTNTTEEKVGDYIGQELQVQFFL